MDFIEEPQPQPDKLIWSSNDYPNITAENDQGILFVKIVSPNGILSVLAIVESDIPGVIALLTAATTPAA